MRHGTFFHRLVVLRKGDLPTSTLTPKWCAGTKELRSNIIVEATEDFVYLLCDDNTQVKCSGNCGFHYTV